MTVGSIQLELIVKAKKYLQENSKKKINVDSSGNCFLCAGGISPGYGKLKLWHTGFKNILKAAEIFCKDIISISNLHNYYLANRAEVKGKYEKIIISWGFKNRFLSDGSYEDRYFKVNSKDTKNALWFLINFDEDLPEKINENILILTKTQSRYKYNFLYLIKVIIKNIVLSNFSPKKFFHTISSSTEFSSIICSSLKNYINKDTKTIIMPYECQPFQNRIFKTCKNINEKIKTIGYVHAFPVGLPTNYISREGSPEKLIINGNDQYYCFKEYLNWNNDQLKVLPSTRFTKSFESMSNTIYLPLFINSSKLIIKSLQNLITRNADSDFSNLIIKNHPLTEKSEQHIKLIEEIKNLLKSYSNIASERKVDSKFSIFIGSTSSPIEALERVVNVIHICDDPVFQRYSSTLWPSIKTKKIDENTFEYQLSKKGNLIQLGSNPKIFQEEYFN